MTRTNPTLRSWPRLRPGPGRPLFVNYRRGVFEPAESATEPLEHAERWVPAQPDWWHPREGPWLARGGPYQSCRTLLCHPGVTDAQPARQRPCPPGSDSSKAASDGAGAGLVIGLGPGQRVVRRDDHVD